VTLRRRPRSAALLRLGYRVAYRLLQAWTFLRRPRVRGVMVVVSDPAGRVLLVRHTYGDRRRWELPGGWVRPDEDPVAAARREVREELGIDVAIRPAGTVDGEWDHKHERLSYFAADWPGGRGSYDPVEIAAVGWFDPALPPDRLGAGTRAVLARLRAG
jgi:8-oxo-dGTP pyrophosphatase MutT (NUDIX family)